MTLVAEVAHSDASQLAVETSTCKRGATGETENRFGVGSVER